MLGEAIAGLLPPAVGVALSPFPIVAVVLVLATPRARTAGPAFALGWVAGLVAATAALVGLLGAADDAGGDARAGVQWLRLAVGVLLLGLAAKQWRGRPRAGEAPPAPGWMASLDALTAPRAALLGAGLASVNPKNLALVFAAAAAIARADLDGAQTAIAVAAFVAVGSVSVAGAVLLHLLAPRRAEGTLAEVRGFMVDHSAAIMTVVLLLLGAKLVGDGLAGLTG